MDNDDMDKGRYYFEKKPGVTIEQLNNTGASEITQIPLTNHFFVAKILDKKVLQKVAELSQEPPEKELEIHVSAIDAMYSNHPSARRARNALKQENLPRVSFEVLPDDLSTGHHLREPKRPRSAASSAASSADSFRTPDYFHAKEEPVEPQSDTRSRANTSCLLDESTRDKVKRGDSPNSRNKSKIAKASHHSVHLAESIAKRTRFGKLKRILTSPYYAEVRANGST
jgi:hypothetical protein